MKNTKSLLLAIVALSGCTSRGVGAGLDNYAGTCTVALTGHPAYTTACTVYDHDPGGITPGFWNNWYVRIDYLPPEVAAAAVRPRIADWVRAESLPDGTLRWSSLLTGMVTIAPYDTPVQEHNAAHPAYDSRAQHVEVTATDDGAGVVIHIDEPVGETAEGGTRPSGAWLMQNVDAHVRYGKHVGR